MPDTLATQLYSLAQWRAEMRVSGADAQAFLQGQLSADMARLTHENWSFAAYNSAKGRMLAMLGVRRDGAEFVLETERDIVDAVIRRLRMFVLRAKVSLAVSEDAMLAIAGPQAAQRLAEVGLAVPDAPRGQTHVDGVMVVRRAVADAFSVHGAGADIGALHARLAPHCSEGSEAQWRRLEIEAGIATVRAATQDRFVPQMANVDVLGGISFDKGCYTGQEVVARLHYLGQVKRRLFACRGRGPLPQAGDAVLTADGETAGDVCDAADVGDGEFVASAVLQLGRLEAGPLRVGEATVAITRRFDTPGVDAPG